MPETAEPTNSLAAVPVKAAFALAGVTRAPLTVTSSTYQPSKLLAAPLLRKSNWILTLALPTYGVRSKLALIQPEVGSLSRPGWVVAPPLTTTRLAAPASRRVASALRTWSGANVVPPLVEMRTRARSIDELVIGSVARKYLKFRVALVSPARLIVGD